MRNTTGKGSGLVLVGLSMPQSAMAHGLFGGHLFERAPLWLTAALIAVAWLLYILGSLRVPPRRSEAFWLHGALIGGGWITWRWLTRMWRRQSRLIEDC